MAPDDLAFFANEVPGFYLFRFRRQRARVTDAPAKHSPHFHVHEPAMETGVRALLAETLDRADAGAIVGNWGALRRQPP